MLSFLGDILGRHWSTVTTTFHVTPFKFQVPSFRQQNNLPYFTDQAEIVTDGNYELSAKLKTKAMTMRTQFRIETTSPARDQDRALDVTSVCLVHAVHQGILQIQRNEQSARQQQQQGG